VTNKTNKQRKQNKTKQIALFNGRILTSKGYFFNSNFFQDFFIDFENLQKFQKNSKKFQYILNIIFIISFAYKLKIIDD